METKLKTRRKDSSPIHLFKVDSMKEHSKTDHLPAKAGDFLRQQKKAHVKIWIFTLPYGRNTSTILLSPKNLMKNEVLELLCWSPTSYSYKKKINWDIAGILFFSTATITLIPTC